MTWRRTKLIITGVYALSWGLCLLDAWAVVAAKALFAVVVGTMTFGPGWTGR